MPELSLRPTLETDLHAAYQRNVDTGLVTPDATQSLGATAAAAATAGRQRRGVAQRERDMRFAELSPEAWIVEEMDEAAAKFDRYNGLFLNGDFASPDIDEILDSHDFGVTTLRLHDAKKALYESGLENPDGEKISDSMKIVLMPWQAFRNNFEKLPEALIKLRARQGIKVEDDIAVNILDMIQQDAVIYSSYLLGGGRFSPRSYLDTMIDRYGAWGVALMQTSDTAGVKDLVGKSPNELTLRSNGALHVGGATHLGNMGIFEWLALTLQEDPEALSSQDVSWMLANRFNIRGVSFVAEAMWDSDRVRVASDRADLGNKNTRPRLTAF